MNYSPYSSQLLRVWFDRCGSLRASVYVGVAYRAAFQSSLPAWLDASGIWTGKPETWACLVADPREKLDDPFPAVRLYFMLVDALARAMQQTDLPY